MVDTGGHDRPLILLPEVIGAGDEGDDLIRFGIGIEYHGGIFPRGIVPVPKIRITGKDRPFGRLPSLHDIREAHGVAHLGVWGLDEYSLMLRSEGFIAIPLDVAETGDRVPEGQAVSEDDGIRTLKALLLAFCVEIERTQGIVVPVDIVMQVVIRVRCVGLQDGMVDIRPRHGYPSDNIPVHALPVIPINSRELGFLTTCAFRGGFLRRAVW